MTLPSESATDKLLREMRQRERLLDEAAGLSNPVMEAIRAAKLNNLVMAASGASSDLSQTVRTLREHDLYRDLVSRIAIMGTGSRASDVANLMASNPSGGLSEAAEGMAARTARGRIPAAVPSAAGSRSISGAAQLGPLIRQARKAMKLNQAQFAAHAGVGRRFLSELESGKASLEFDKVLACAQAAGIDILARPRRS